MEQITIPKVETPKPVLSVLLEDALADAMKMPTEDIRTIFQLEDNNN